MGTWSVNAEGGTAGGHRKDPERGGGGRKLGLASRAAQRGEQAGRNPPALPPISLNLYVCAHGRWQWLHRNHKEPSRQQFKTCDARTQVSCQFSDFLHVEQEALL